MEEETRTTCLKTCAEPPRPFKVSDDARHSKMKLPSIVRIVYDILVWQVACSVLITVMLVSVSIEHQYQHMNPYSVLHVSLFASIQWMVVAMMLLTMDMLFLPPIFLIMHAACGLPFT